MAVALRTHHLHRFFRQISESAPEALMLGGSAEVTPLNQWVIIGLQARQRLTLQDSTLRWTHPLNEEHREWTGAEGPEPLFALLESARQQCQQWPQEKQIQGLPMAGGLVGVLGYEFYRWCDSGWQKATPAKSTEWPELQLWEFEDWLFIHLKTASLTVLSNNPQSTATYQQAWQTCLAEPLATGLYTDVTDPNLSAAAMADYLESFQVSFQPEAFTQAVEQLKRDIFNGEVYQANLSLQLGKAMALDPYELFERLCLKNPSPFAGFLKSTEGILVCNSPERLVQLDEQAWAQTRPIAGTRGRGQTPSEDEAIGQALRHNEKEQAEHMMLVDLARNDLGRVCQPGSVQVNDLLVLERYSHVTHLVSNVIGQLQPQQNGWALIRSLFPGGTITGCPKIRCVELLSDLEPVSRGLYTGSLGYLDASSPALDFNILIRSVYLKPLPHLWDANALRYNVAVHVGAGIVHDAVGPHEYRECLRKANAILNELYRLEHQPKPM